MRHLLIAASLLLASLLLVQVVAAAFQDSATRGHEVSNDFVPGELPRSALPEMLGPATRAHSADSERSRPEPRPTQPLDNRQRATPKSLDTPPRPPAVPAPAQPQAPAGPPSLKLPSAPVRNTPPPGADRA